MRTLIFIFTLLTLNSFAAPQPSTWNNPWSTNRNVLPVMGTNMLSVSNIISGGNGSNWNFFGIGPRTVAALVDATNIAKAIVAVSNANYVLKYNGPSDGQVATNLTVAGANLTTSQTFDFQDANGNSFLLSDSPNGLMTLGAGGDFSMVYVPKDQTNSGTLDVAGVITDYDFANFLNGINVLGDIDQRIGAGHFWGSANSFSNATTFYYPTASKLAAFDSNKVLTNSPYSDADIATAIAGIANTNAFVRIQSGTMNNVTSTNGNFISPTNQPGASNMVAFNGLLPVGQNTNIMTVRNSSGTEIFGLSSNASRMWLGGKSSTDVELRKSSSLLEITLGDESNYASFRAGLGTFQLITSLSGFNAATKSIIGSATATASALLQLTNSTAQGALRVDTISTNSLIQAFSANTLAFAVETNGQAFFNGNVGIGTNSPAQALDVIGNIKVSGTFSNSGSASFTSGGVTMIGTTISIPANGVFMDGNGFNARDVAGSGFFRFNGSTKLEEETTTTGTWKLTTNLTVVGVSKATNGFASYASNLAAPVTITFPASDAKWTNTTGVNIEIYIDETGVTGTSIKKNNTQIFGGLSLAITFHLQPGEYFAETYSIGTPTATYSPY